MVKCGITSIAFADACLEENVPRDVAFAPNACRVMHCHHIGPCRACRARGLRRRVTHQRHVITQQVTLWKSIQRIPNTTAQTRNSYVRPESLAQGCRCILKWAANRFQAVLYRSIIRYILYCNNFYVFVGRKAHGVGVLVGVGVGLGGTNTNTKYTCDTGQTRNKLLAQWVHLTNHAVGHSRPGTAHLTASREKTATTLKSNF